MKQHMLSDLGIDELSLVDSPANKRSRKVLMKRDTQEAELSLFARLAKRLGFSESLEKDDDLDPALLEALDKAEAAGDNEDGELSDDELEELEKKKLCATDAADKEKKTMPEVTKADLDQLSNTVASALEAITKKDEEIAKRDETISKLAAQVEQLAKASAERVQLAKAAAMVGDAPVDKAEVAALLGQLNEDGQATLTKMLGSFSEISRESLLFKAVASISDLSPTATSEVEKALAAIRKADPSITEEQAYAKALIANPELYDELQTSAVSA